MSMLSSLMVYINCIELLSPHRHLAAPFHKKAGIGSCSSQLILMGFEPLCET